MQQLHLLETREPGVWLILAVGGNHNKRLGKPHSEVSGLGVSRTHTRAAETRDVRHRRPSMTRAKREVDFLPRIGLETGFAEFLNRQRDA